ncbi:hypothetical protein [Nocardia bovistercoris]|uniref:Uncharacterized protein n=1 Tax=Nocardia bovistercoris TaxID=2785916 RepID=A0A931IIZ0_9NOCA|nr:hypothetical protein [Nocardia bovistercoris]MBH0781468.1 hypothetical protein [Nocardia bovistercoris]
MSVRREITYTDELLSDGTVHRRYSDARQEWRMRGHGVVTWRDHSGGSGADEPLGPKLIKRVFHDGTVRYGRECGYGRTLWSDGTLTVNRSSFGGRLGMILAGVAGGALLGSLVMPPDFLSPGEEEELRNQAMAQQSSSGGGGEDYGAWDDDSGDDGGGDFG